MFLTGNNDTGKVSVRAVRGDGSSALLAEATLASKPPAFLDWVDSHGHVWWDAWASASPNGAWVAWYHDGQLRILDARTGAESALPVLGNPWEVIWSPDGTRFVFEENTLARKTYVAWPAIGQLATVVDPGDASLDQIAWSPDGLGRLRLAWFSPVLLPNPGEPFIL